LAVCGGAPVFPDKRHVGRPNLGDRARLLQRINDILDRRWLTNAGSYVQEFERRVAELAGAKHCIAVCNGTVALEIAIRALEMKGEVIVPAFTFVATAHALQWQEITPVFADVDPATHLIDPASVPRLLTPRTTGIIGVHLWGQPSPIEELAELAQRHHLRLIFDASHAFGCEHRGQRIGGFGDAEVFSFHATKFVNSLEGGAITTNRDDLAAKLRLMKNFGFRGFDHVGYIGTNGKMNEFSAAMGLTTLESMDEFVAFNERHYRRYQQGLAGIPGVRVLRYAPSGRFNFQYVVADVDPAACPLARDRLLDVLWAEGVLARRYFYPGCHRMQPYRDYFPNAGLLLPHTERVCAGVLILPTGQSVTGEDIDGICGLIRLAVAEGRELTQRLEGSPFRVHPDYTVR
jgi:dTDP-4-amino-4,6-dideoxygalactose transaminase